MKRLRLLPALCFLLCLASCGKPAPAGGETVSPSPTVATRRDNGIYATLTEAARLTQAAATPTNSVTPAISDIPTPSGTVTPPLTGTPVPTEAGTPTPTSAPTPTSKLYHGGGGGGGNGGNGKIELVLSDTLRITEVYGKYFTDKNGKRITEISAVDLEAYNQYLTAELFAYGDPLFVGREGRVYATFAGAYYEKPTRDMWLKYCDYWDQRDAEEARLHPTPTPTPTPTPVITPEEGVEPTPEPSPEPTEPLRNRNEVPERILIIDETGEICAPPNLFSSSVYLSTESEVHEILPTPTLPPEYR